LTGATGGREPAALQVVNPVSSSTSKLSLRSVFYNHQLAFVIDRFLFTNSSVINIQHSTTKEATVLVFAVFPLRKLPKLAPQPVKTLISPRPKQGLERLENKCQHKQPLRLPQKLTAGSKNLRTFPVITVLGTGGNARDVQISGE